MARRISAPVLVGRDAELTLLQAALAEARAGAVRTVVMGGESGIGKSRLVAELLAVARAGGWSVHAGACAPGSEGAPVPYAPFGAVLRSIVRSVDARLLDHLLGAGRRDLAALLPELGDPDPAWSAVGGAARLFEAVLSLVERSTRRGNGVVLVLEDLHWADPAARALFAWLVQELRRVPVLMIATHRTDLDPGDPLPDLLVELDRADGYEHLELVPLAAADAGRLLAALTADALSVDLRAGIVRRAGGVPLYLEELVSEGVTDAPPASVRVAVARRLTGLDADALRVVRLAAVAGRPVEPVALAAVAGLAPGAITACISSAIDAGLLRALGPAITGPTEVGMRHALIAEAVMALLPPGLGPSQHAAWAGLLRGRPDLGPASSVERTAVLAHHLVAAGERDAAVPALLAAADAATEARAFATADAGYAHAFALADDRLAALVDDPVAALDAAARAAWLAGRPLRAVGLVTAAMGSATDAPDADQALRRRTRLASYQVAAGSPAMAIEELEAVVALAPAGQTRIRARIELGRLLTAAGDPRSGAERCRVALAEAQGAGDRRAATRAGIALGVALSAAGLHQEAALVLVEARRTDGESMTARSVGGGSVSRLPDTLARHLDEATLLLHLGDLEGSLDAALRGHRIATDRGLSEAFGAVVVATAGWDLVRLGRWQEADELLATAPPREGDPMTSAPAAVGAWLAAARGRWTVAAALLDAAPSEALAAVPGASWMAIATAAATLAAAGQGRLREAHDRLRAGLRVIDIAGAPSTIAGLTVLGLSVEADAAELARARSDAAALDDALDAAQELAARARSALGVASLGEPAVAGEAGSLPGVHAASVAWHVAAEARLDAELARARGADDGSGWERVIATSDATGDRWGGATARLRLATLLLDAGADRARAAVALAEAVTVARDLGAEPLVVAVERLARRARIPLPVDPATGDASGPRVAAMALGLSEREVDVLELLAVGRTDREIAEQLFITEKTAGHHVSHILAKLGVSRRGEAAAVAHRIGLAARDD